MADSGPANVPTPGFFHLDLFIKDTKDISQWYDELKTRLDRETGPMASGMTNLLSVFAFYKPRGKGEARKLLEDLTAKDETNLNAIANKQFMYGQLMRAKDEMTCRDRLQELLSDDSDYAKARNARCFAEQAYAIAFEVIDQSKDMVSKIKEAIGLFQRALRLACDTEAVTVEESLVWKFYLSKCHWRLDQVKWHDQKTTPPDRLDDLLEAQRLLIEVTQLDPSWTHGGFYIARAWALLGGVESKCRRICRRTCEMYETPDYLTKEIPRPTTSHIAIGPWPEVGCYEKSLEINPNDSEAYRRFGQSYIRSKDYENALCMLNKSIDIMPDAISNWFAYHARSSANFGMYNQQAKHAQRGGEIPSKHLLQKAKEDAMTSCEGAITPFNVYHLGKVCHRLAIHPVTDKVEDRGELEDALDNFAQALQLEDGYTNPKIHAARGRSLEAAEEYEKAAESYKRAVEHENAFYFWNFAGVLTNLLKLHRAVDGDVDRTKHYIAELAFWINEGYKKYRDITSALRYCVFNFGYQMMQVCRYLVDHDSFQLSRICLKCFRDHNSRTFRTEAESMLSEIHGKTACGEMVTPSAQYRPPEARAKLPVAVDKPRHSQDFQYDFFVSHSSKDEDWVNYALLPALEVDLRFKGCIADRDFIAGKDVFANIIDSIENSFKTLLILTPDFVNSEWCLYETKHALMESLKGKTGRVIPIMLKECDVPASVRTITYLDVSHDAIGSYDWRRLKEALEATPPNSA
ncbi:PREDICTED: tetratricopeptide repeat protein 22-like [Branchiostoma belcheri]|uniref:Tetratricopeptide repeat protein 22-like n=1 Tax=Branchiostoma belcheri TaxID=7741 RepID=A0A6P5A1N9_BRABE|nr:PREDICTED: tetratricopeptide repeat protein 22-like [Branchiostoma belcheri]